ncbi:MAG: hypothetical protein ACRDI1_10650 [Actinomycetota bacterium]
MAASDADLYYTAPFRDPWRGRDAIVAGWLGRKDEPGKWEFEWGPILLSSNIASSRARP